MLLAPIIIVMSSLEMFFPFQKIVGKKGNELEISPLDWRFKSRPLHLHEENV
jgi:hypothetical protein